MLLVRLSSAVLTCFLSSVYLSPQFPSVHCLVIVNLLRASRSAHLTHSLTHHSLTHSLTQCLMFCFSRVCNKHRPHPSPACIWVLSSLSPHTDMTTPLSCTACNSSCQTVTYCENKRRNTPFHLKASPNCQIHHLSLSHNHQISLRSFQKVGHIYF